MTGTGVGEEKSVDSLPVAVTAPLSLPLKPSTTLQGVYDSITKHYDLTGRLIDQLCD
jgi:hypothetical protein